jgi:secreted trypsin-like serine protease
MRLKYLGFSILLLVMIHTYSQTTITGVVVDQDDTPLPGVSIIIQGTEQGTVTDFDGNFSISTDATPPIILVFSYVGAQSKVTRIEKSSNIYVRLSEEPKVLIYDEELYPIDAEVANQGEFPWTVSLKKIQNKKKVWCGGVIIDSSWVLSCAHCFQNRDDEGNVTNWLGKNNIFISYGDVNHRKGKRVRIDTIYYPTGNQKYSAESGDNDIVLIRLKKPIIKGEAAVKAIDIVNESELLDSFLVNNVIAVGWGASKKDRTPLELRKTGFPIKSYEDCKLTPSMSDLHFNSLCFGEEPSNMFCPGDSGNGVFFEKDGITKLLGLISKGSKCLDDWSYNKKFSTLTSVLPYKPWIDSIIND